MVYYINVTSWNLLESFVTESLSPHIFYLERSYGNNLSRYLDLNNELGNFLVLSTRDTNGDYSIQIDDSLIDIEYLCPVKGYTTLFTYSKSIYYKKGCVSFRFCTLEKMNALIAESHILLEVKCVEKYQDSFYIKQIKTLSVDVALKLSENNEFSFNLSDSVKKDNLYNNIKGAIIGYTRGMLTTSNAEEQNLKSELIFLKNMFAGLNTSVMISGEIIKDTNSVVDSIQKCKSQYNSLRTVKTNQFDILCQQFKEVANIAMRRSEEMKDFSEFGKLKEEKDQLKNKISEIEEKYRIYNLRQDLQCLKNQEKKNGEVAHKCRIYFKEGTPEYNQKKQIKEKISQFEKSNKIYDELRNITQKIDNLNNGNMQFDGVIRSVFLRISDIMNDLIKKVDDTEEYHKVDYKPLKVLSNGKIEVDIPEASISENQYFNEVLTYLIDNPISEPISDAFIIKLIVETSKIYKTLPSSEKEEGKQILKCLREFWLYKNLKTTSFSIPEGLPVFQSVMSFYVKPFGFEQMERYILNNKFKYKTYAFMLWGVCLGYAALPKTFTNIIYQDEDVNTLMDNYLNEMINIVQ